MIPGEEKKRLALYFSKKNYIIKRNNIKTSWCYLLLELKFCYNQKQTHEKLCKNKDFCGIIMPSEKDKILEFTQYMKSDKMVK